MKQIWKYNIPANPNDVHTFRLPSNHRFLSAQLQGVDIAVWFEVDPASDATKEFICRVVGTGEPYDPESVGDYLATVLVEPYVWHLFEGRA